MKSLVFILVFGLLLHFHPTVVSPWPRGPDYTERRVMCGLQYVRAAISICGPNMWTMRPRNGSGPIVPPPDFLAMYGMRNGIERNNLREQLADDEIVNSIDDYLQHNDISSQLKQKHEIPWSRSQRVRRARYKPPLSKKCCSTGCNREDFRGYCYL
ncbi:relaxin-like protein AGF [Hypanus sabinus]|uniref:relaxin-like protein AGF n=1 Tax=Hypanus sabinus TaxID=79690 RepID=UPI0028C404DC|nr:relaxin-like protein AGF [Hypanus sabinus]XP_059829849.1 relaxin-like protein AGF [Hypanus sabinus]XP_059829850.1 relaxin-like protein AGF [Hypanus sabinus]